MNTTDLLGPNATNSPALEPTPPSDLRVSIGNPMNTSTKLTKEQKRIRLAEALGWRQFATVGTLDGKKLCGNHPSLTEDDKNFPDKEGNWLAPIPEYATDLNAMHEAEHAITPQQWEAYTDDIASYGVANAITSDASMRFETLGLTLHLWKEGE